jgi:hypothetical protein
MTVISTAAVVIHADTDPGITPNTTGLPGLDVVKEIVGALLFWGLIGCVAGLVVSSGALAIAKATERGGMADRAKTGVIWAAVAALLLGGANAIIAFFSLAGSQI